METIFTVGAKASGWRLMAPLCLACGVGMAVVGWDFLLHYSYEGSGGVLAPLTTRIPVGGVFLAVGLGIVVGTAIYGLCYVARIQVDRGEDQVRITVAGYVLGRSFTIRPGDIVSARYNDGYYDGGRTIVNAPWTTVRLRGRRLPLIVDERGHFLDSKAVDRLIHHHTLDLLVMKKRREGNEEG